jgi:hypothetical protein
MRGQFALFALFACLLTCCGCWHGRPEITAVPLSPQNCGEPAGIPFYLPKPLLIVSKNFRYIEEAKVGLTDSAPIPAGFDDQAKYGDVNARTSFVQGPPVSGFAAAASSSTATNTGTASASVPRLHSGGAPITPGDAPSDGLSPSTFYTYQIVFVPDLTQKYGLRIKGGAGEIRAAMNLVNGWQFTGLGPYYMKDSSTAQNVLAHGIATNLAGSGVADVVSSVADLAGELQSGELAAPDSPKVQRVVQTMESLQAQCVPMTIPNFAEIHVYEPYLSFDGMMEWREITCLNFDRDYLGQEKTAVEFAPSVAPSPLLAPQASLQSGEVQANAQLGRMAVAHVLGIPLESPALSGGSLQAGEVGVPAGGVNQIHVECGDGKEDCKPHEFNLFKFGDHGGLFHHHQTQERPRIETRAVVGSAFSGFVPSTVPAAPPSVQGGGGLQSGEVLEAPGRTTLDGPIINQPTINQPTFHPSLPTNSLGPST